MKTKYPNFEMVETTYERDTYKFQMYKSNTVGYNYCRINIMHKIDDDYRDWCKRVKQQVPTVNNVIIGMRINKREAFKIAINLIRYILSR